MDTIYLVANGDLRLSANQNCWPAQAEMENQLTEAIERKGARVQRAHPYDPVKKHGFIDSQKTGIQVFHDIPTEAPLVLTTRRTAPGRPPATVKPQTAPDLAPPIARSAPFFDSTILRSPTDFVSTAGRSSSSRNRA